MGATQVDVVVLSRDRPDLFASCLAHLEAQNVDYHGFLVDNGTDGTTAQLAKGWEVINEGRNTGFSEGNNLAIARGDSDRVLLLNNDAFMQPGALAAMLGHDGIVASVNVSSDGRVNFAGGRFSYHGVPKHVGRLTMPDQWPCRQRAWVTFACCLIDRAVLDAVGPLDERYWYGFEDVDFCLRARKHQVTPWVCGDAVVVHDESTTRQSRGDGENLARFLRTYGHELAK